MSNKDLTATPEAQTVTPAERATRFSRALADAARRSRFSTRRRQSMSAGGFSGRYDAVAFRIFLQASFALLFILPTVCAIIYFGFWASDQYYVEANFNIRSGELPKVDGLGSLTGLPSIAIVQDTQIVTNYLQSRAIVEDLEKRIDLRALYSRDGIDFFARFNPNKPIEKLVKYWQWMTDDSIHMPSGVVTFSVRAFRAEDATLIGNTALTLAESLVNDMNNRMHRDALQYSEQELSRANQRLVHARTALERARNAEGLLDVGRTANAISDLLTKLKGDRLEIQQEYDTQLRNVSKDAPQMRALQSRLTAADTQIAELESKLTSVTAGQSQNTALSGQFTKFSELELEQQIAQRQYTAAFTGLETARIANERKMIYLNAFVRPSLPEEAKYPKRALSIFAVALISLVLWGALCGAVAGIRNYMA